MKGIQQCVTETTQNRWLNPPALQGIVIDDAAVLSAYPTGAAGRLLVLGDSIAEGVVSTGINLSAVDDTQYSYGRMSFINQVCSALNLECWNHAFGGSGFNAATPGGQPRTDQSYALAASGIAAADPSMDIVVIEAVNNDSSMDSATFTARYQATINAVRADHPAATLVLMEPFIGFAADLSDEVVALAAANSAIYVNPVAWTYTHPYASHPDVAGHTAIAAYMQTVLAPYVPSDIEDVVTTGALEIKYSTGILSLDTTVGGAFEMNVGGTVYNFALSTGGPVEINTSLGVMSLA